ncbi:MAG TPA: hypothetical protein VHN14_15805 [Kofleriaceae bacterium]|nr:hypothetical protein [Kofleriaceae bacterium]
MSPEPDRVPVDPIAALTPDDDVELSWVVPGPIQLELGGTQVASAGSGRPIEIGPIDRQGNLERVAVRLEHARFSVWIDRAQMLSVVQRDQRIDVTGVPAIGSDVAAILRAGATVRRLAHRDRSTQIRYLGALEVEGWVPDSVLGDRGHARDGIGRIPTGRKTLMVIPGAVIRTEPRWAASPLAIVVNGYFLDTIREVDEAWTEVGYEDGDVSVHGFVSKRDPPGHVHHWRETDGTPVITPNTTVASGTCLYARPSGDTIGYIVGNRPVDLEDAGRGWWMLTIDTPWGPLGFAAKGPARTELVACAPPNTVPPATPGPSAPPAP